VRTTHFWNNIRQVRSKSKGWKDKLLRCVWEQNNQDSQNKHGMFFSQYCYKYCYSDSRNFGAVMKARGLTLYNLIQPTISLEMAVPSQGHYGLHSVRLLTDFVCLYTDEF
jgi:hypothetical protein